VEDKLESEKKNLRQAVYEEFKDAKEERLRELTERQN
jgi:hypothetical protein